MSAPICRISTGSTPAPSAAPQRWPTRISPMATRTPCSPSSPRPRTAFSSQKRRSATISSTRATRSIFACNRPSTINIVVPFTFVGVVREFPTAPKDSFLVANAAFVGKATGSEAHEVVLVRASDPGATAHALKSVLASDPALKVTELGEVRSLISSSLTAVSLSALTKVELAFGLVLIGAAAGLVVGLGFAERHRTFAILTALGASASQLGAFLRSEAALVAIAGLTFGTATGLAIAWMLVELLAGVFDPPPEAVTIPYGYLAIVVIGVAVVAATVVVAFQHAHARVDPAALKAE